MKFENKNNVDETVVEFKGVKGRASIEGYMIVPDDIDDDDFVTLNFYTPEGFENGERYPNNPFPEFHDGLKVQNHEDFENLKYAMETDDMLIQTLFDFAEKEATLNMGEYTLIINDGE